MSYTISILGLGGVNKKVNDEREEDCIAEEAKKTTGA
jgi:hypothetical protein